MRTIETKRLTTIEDFQSLKKGDYVYCKFQRNVGGSNGFREGFFQVYENKEYDKEIILEKKRNIYFNYEMFLSSESNLEDILLIK